MQALSWIGLAALLGCSLRGTGDGGFVAAPHRSVPPLNKHQGGMVSPLTLVTITAANDSQAENLQAFGDALVESQWFRTVAAPYGVPQPSVSVHRPDQPPIAGTMSSGEVVTYIENVAQDAGPSPNGSTVYLLYLPDAGSLSGTGFVGYHAPYPSRDLAQGDSYAVVERSDPQWPETELQRLTQIASHEILEAATDPFDGWFSGPAPGQAWTASVWESLQPNDIEVGDLCERTRVAEPDGGGFLYQRIFDNLIAMDGGDDPCVPLQTGPYFNVTVEQDWYQVKVGQAVSIPFTGWSNQPTSNWLVYPELQQSTFDMLPIAADLDAGTELGVANRAPCFLRPAINNGLTGTLGFHVPPNAAPGDWAVLSILSFNEGAGPDGCDTPLDQDTQLWLVGVYVSAN